MLELCGIWLGNWHLILQNYYAWIHIFSLYNITAYCLTISLST